MRGQSIFLLIIINFKNISLHILFARIFEWWDFIAGYNKSAFGAGYFFIWREHLQFLSAFRTVQNLQSRGLFQCIAGAFVWHDIAPFFKVLKIPVGLILNLCKEVFFHNSNNNYCHFLNSGRLTLKKIIQNSKKLLEIDRLLFYTTVHSTKILIAHY